MTTASSTPDQEERDQTSENPPESESPGQEEPSGQEEQNGSAGDEESLGTRSEVEVLGPCKLKIKAQVPPEKVAELLDRNYRDLISTLQIPGFRRGKVPRRLVEKRYGEEIEKDLQEALLGDSFAEVIKEKELNIVGQPKFGEIQFKKEEAFRYEVEVETRPEFEVGSYKGIEVARDSIPVTSEDIEEDLNALRQRYAALEPIDKAEAGPEDAFSVSYRILKDGAEVTRVEERVFVPSKGFLDGIEIPESKERFAARGGADNLSFTLKVPEDHHLEAVRGQEVNLEVTILDAKRSRLPEANDEFARNFGCETIAELRTHIQENLTVRHRRQEELRMDEAILKAIESKVEFELPEGLLEDQKRVYRVRLQLELLELGRSAEEVEEELKKAEAPAEDEIRVEMKRFFILEKIAEKEKIFATEDDLREQIEVLARAYGKRPKDLARELEENGRLAEMRTGIRHSRVKRFLREKAKVAAGAEAVPAAPPPAGGGEAASAAAVPEST